MTKITTHSTNFYKEELMDNTIAELFRTIAENARGNFEKNHNAEDYIADDGFWHCGICGTAKQCRIPPIFEGMP